MQHDCSDLSIQTEKLLLRKTDQPYVQSFIQVFTFSVTQNSSVLYKEKGTLEL